jgi:ATP-dependent protease ClpP protease subunit
MPTRYILFTADVQAAQVGKLRNALVEAANAGNNVCLIMSSGGGNVVEGLGIAALMKTLPIEISTHNIGQTDSIANVIFAAGSRRYATAQASFLFHGVTLHFEKVDLMESQLQDQHLQVKRLGDGIATAFAGYTGLSIADAQALMAKGDTVLSAQEALVRTIIHEVRDAKVPRGVEVIAIGNA